LEARRRAEQILQEIDERALDQKLLRKLRAVEALERMSGPEARSLLQKLAQGASEARLTRDARATLDRLARRTEAVP